MPRSERCSTKPRSGQPATKRTIDGVERTARVTAVHKHEWELDFATPAQLAGRFSHAVSGPQDMPVVGDWVLVNDGLITAVEPRRGLLARKRPGDVRNDAVVEQPIAANIDVALLAMAVGEDFSLRRLERYLTLPWDSGATPVVVLTKADRDPDAVPEHLVHVEQVALGVETVVTSARTGLGLDELRSHLVPGTTAILLGSSGVGKSSLVNALAGADLQTVTEVRDFDEKGRHTTTVRRLVQLPWGAFLVDTPGLRELQLWGDEESLAGAFPDVEELAAMCRFNDCTHETEPGCAVRDNLSEERLESWRRLRRELAYLARKTDGAAARAERKKWKSISKARRQFTRD